MKGYPAQVTDHIPRKVFRTKWTDNLMTRFNDAAALKDAVEQISELEEVRDAAYMMAHDVWSWPIFYGSNEKFHSAYALFHAAKTKVDLLSEKDVPQQTQSLKINLNLRWGSSVDFTIEDVEANGGHVTLIKKSHGWLSRSYHFIGDRKSIEDLRTRLPVLRLGQLSRY